MRIIDRQNDYYDYLQDYEDTLVFDRRGSFLLSEEIFCRKLSTTSPVYNNSRYHFMLMQCGVTYWFFLVHFNVPEHHILVSDYSLQLIGTWKNYNKPRHIIRLLLIEFKDTWKYGLRDWVKGKGADIIPDRVINKFSDLKSAINHGEFTAIEVISRNLKIVGSQDTCTLASYTSEYSDIPLLKASRIPEFISAEDMYHAIDEYFSLEKTASEKVEAEGTTNKDKIINHGFDTKTSFRGK